MNIFLIYVHYKYIFMSNTNIDYFGYTCGVVVVVFAATVVVVIVVIAVSTSIPRSECY